MSSAKAPVKARKPRQLTTNCAAGREVQEQLGTPQKPGSKVASEISNGNTTIAARVRVIYRHELSNSSVVSKYSARRVSTTSRRKQYSVMIFLRDVVETFFMNPYELIKRASYQHHMPTYTTSSRHFVWRRRAPIYGLSPRPTQREALFMDSWTPPSPMTTLPTTTFCRYNPAWTTGRRHGRNCGQDLGRLGTGTKKNREA